MSYGYTNYTSVQLGTHEIDKFVVTSERRNHMNIINRKQPTHAVNKPVLH